MTRKTTTYECSHGHVAGRRDRIYSNPMHNGANAHRYCCSVCGEVCDRRPTRDRLRAAREQIDLMRMYGEEPEVVLFTATQAEEFLNPVYEEASASGRTPAETAAFLADLDALSARRDAEVAVVVDHAEAEDERQAALMALIEEAEPPSERGWVLDDLLDDL